MALESCGLLVLGMHRSGTSALTGLLHLHGIPLGADIIGAAPDNLSGFWENRKVVEFHERLLGAIGSSWDDPRELPSGWLETATSDGLLDELITLISTEFSGAQMWATKDPRMCRLLPLWQIALKRLRVTPKLIIALRDPGEVVGSLMRRNGLSAASASLLWLRHLAETVQAVGDNPRCIVDYADLMGNWQANMARVSEQLEIAWPVASEACHEAATHFLSNDLQHQHAKQTHVLLPDHWRAWLLDVYAQALDAGKDKRAWPNFVTLLNNTVARFDEVRPLIADITPASKLQERQQQLEAVKLERDDYCTEAKRLFKEVEAAQRQVAATTQRWEQALSEMKIAWDAEKRVRIVAEQHAKQQAQAAHDAQQAWQAERQVREAAEQQAAQQVQATAEALNAWESEQRVREAAEQQAAQTEQKLSEARTRLVAAQGEIIKRNALLESTQAELDLIKNSRSWKLTKPLRFLMRTLRNRGLTEDDRNQLGLAPKRAITLQKSPAAPLSLTEGDAQPLAAQSGASVETALAAQPPQQRDVFVWAVIDWHFRIQRPQHLARELAAEGHRVFYISNNFINRAEPGFSVEPLDAEGRLFQVHLHLAGSPAIYHAAPNAAQCEQLRASVAQLLAWTHSRRCLSLVQHPYWLETAQVLPNQRLVYDCMDHHAGFADNADSMLAREQELMRKADLLVVTSDWLYEEAGHHNPNRLMVRNACQYEHFCTIPAEVFRDAQGRRVIGYYGAIAEWFDLELVEAVAKQHPDCLVLLVGNDTAGAQRKLKHLSNVQFTGEVPYAQLPFYLYGFDVCLLPFHVIPLTLATNPVKVYEYLSAGKEVVSVDLPEMRQFGDLVRIGTSHAAFLAEVSNALQTSKDGSLAAPRRAFAEAQTWAHRVQDLVQGIEDVPQPKVSVVVVTYNNLEFNRACLDSLQRLTDYPALEVIVVDNASADETPALLREWVTQGENRKIILNADNKGFAAANNQGLEAASGDYLVMLNNDTYVTPGWVSGLVRHFQRSPDLGMLGPVTNNIGNEARIEIHYADMTQMLEASGQYTAKHAGLRTPLHTAAFFCVMMPRYVYEKVGALDEAFGIGMFEDDDYCRRVQQEGWEIACADDVFIHHHLSASFDQIKLERRKEMFEHNKAIYEAKWGAWMPHQYRHMENNSRE